MAKKDSSKKTKSSKPKNASKSVEFNLDGNVDKSVIVVGDKATVNYYAAVSANTKQNDPDFWNLKHPYPMPPNFTGRIEERAMLTQWLDGDFENRLFILRALGGFGKSALAWQWLTHDVNPETWKKVVFWSFYEGDASFEHFAEEVLKYLKREVPPSKRDQVDVLLRAMQADNILLIMDGFERALRAYSSMNAAYQGDEELKLDGNHLDCVDINAEWFLKGVCALPNMKSKVLMTTRLTPRVAMVGATRESPLQGCRETELTAMQKADAVSFFHKQGIQGNRVEIETACESYGYHPLSLRLLAGRILKDFENPGDISVAQKLKIDGDIIQQKHHVLEVSYNSLPKLEQKLLGTIACFRSPVEYKTLKEIASDHNLDDELNDLIERGLLHRTNRLISSHPISIFDLHPIVRRFAYDRLTAADRTGAHERLVNYFEAVSKPEKVEKLEDLAPVIELYHHMVRAGKLDEAVNLLDVRLRIPLYYHFGAYQIYAELLECLLPNKTTGLARLSNKGDQAWIYNELGNAYSSTGLPVHAMQFFEAHALLRENLDNKLSLAIGLGNLASSTQMPIGKLKISELNLRRRIDLGLEIDDKYVVGIGYAELGRLLVYIGSYNQAEKELAKAIELLEAENAIQYIGIVWVYRVLVLLSVSRTHPKLRSKKAKLAIEYIFRARELIVEFSRSTPVFRDYIDVYWLLGSAYRIDEELSEAEENLSKAISMCRQINLVEIEANILLDLARLRYDQKSYKEANALAEKALLITKRCGYVLQGADVNLFLAQYALEQEKDKAKAKVYAEEAKKLATCDGPPYYYKVAYEEAEAMLEKLK